MPADTDLRALVRSRGSLRRVAAAIGEHEATLRDWCSGRRTPHPDRLAAVMARIEALPDLGDGRCGKRASAPKRGSRGTALPPPV